jgi:hypothetical protein
MSLQWHIKALGLENFLSYSKQPPVDLGRLNVFIGRNSSGKSAVLHALALLSETVGDASPYTSLLLAGNDLNLGTFRDVVYKNRSGEAIAFDISMVAHGRGRRRPATSPTRFRMTFKEDEASRRPYLSAVAAYSRDDDRCFTLQGFPGGGSPGYRATGYADYKQKPAGVVPSIRHFLPYFEDRTSTSTARGRKRIATFMSVNEASDQLASILERLVYFGPSRAPLDAVYFPVGRYPEKLDSTGSNAVPLVLGRVRTAKDRRHFNTVMDTWLGARFGLVSSAGLEGLRGGHGFRLEGVDPLIRATVVLSNTGYGVSQILPIVLQLALGVPGVLLIEQPEIHLHPSAQAELANLLVEFVDLGYQVFVETHSEHLILRLRAMLARDEIGVDSEEIKLFHVEKEKGGSRLRPVEISATGSLSGWPKGFFSASADDLATILARGKN